MEPLLVIAYLFSEPAEPIRKLSGDAITHSLQLDHATSKYCPIKIDLFIATLMIIYSQFLSLQYVIHRTCPRENNLLKNLFPFLMRGTEERQQKLFHEQIFTKKWRLTCHA